MTPEEKRARHAANERRRMADPEVRAAKRERERQRYADDPEYRERRRASVRGRTRARQPSRKAPEAQRKARQRVADALRRGKLTKPASCEGCNVVTPSRRLHAHHDDYSAPLEVTWLCTSCHGAEHRRLP